MSTAEQATSWLPPSIWTGIVAGLFAFAGVIIAQRSQGKRDEQNRKHELQIYSDTWGEQRDRDRELWKREDRHRFAQHRVKIYADFLAEHNNFMREILGLEAMRDAGAQLSDDILRKTRRVSDKFHFALHQVRIVAPRDIAQNAMTLSSTLAIGYNKVIDTPPAIILVPGIDELFRETHDLNLQLVEQMRGDLGADS